MTVKAPEREPPSLSEKSQSARAGVGVCVADVAKTFSAKRGDVAALSRLTINARPGEVIGVLGPSGCGKSTLLQLVCGLEQPSTGAITVGARTEPHERLRRCALMPQRDLLLPWRSALDNAALALELAGASRMRARREAAPLFERFGLAGFAHARPRELSGGMRQRVAFLRTLLAGKPVLLLDEPFGALDSITRADMQEWLAAALTSEPRTALLVTHDTDEALFLCDRVAILSPRPGSVTAEIAVDAPRALPRAETVTSAGFAALKQRALEALS